MTNKSRFFVQIKQLILNMSCRNTQNSLLKKLREHRYIIKTVFQKKTLISEGFDQNVNKIWKLYESIVVEVIGLSLFLYYCLSNKRAS